MGMCVGVGVEEEPVHSQTGLVGTPTTQALLQGFQWLSLKGNCCFEKNELKLEDNHVEQPTVDMDLSFKRFFYSS